MKLELLNENQVKVTMTGQDLSARNVTMPELACGSEKGRALFAEIISEIKSGFDFDFDEDFPLFVEIFTSPQDITLVLTKVPVPPHCPRAFRGVKTLAANAARARADMASVFRFATLEQSIDAAERFGAFAPDYDGANALYKLDDEFYLILRRDPGMPENNYINAERRLSDFGAKTDNTNLFRAFITEHGKLIAEQPIQNFWKYL